MGMTTGKKGDIEVRQRGSMQTNTPGYSKTKGKEAVFTDSPQLLGSV